MLDPLYSLVVGAGIGVALGMVQDHWRVLSIRRECRRQSEAHRKMVDPIMAGMLASERDGVIRLPAADIYRAACTQHTIGLGMSVADVLRAQGLRLEVARG